MLALVLRFDVVSLKGTLSLVLGWEQPEPPPPRESRLELSCRYGEAWTLQAPAVDDGRL